MRAGWLLYVVNVFMKNLYKVLIFIFDALLHDKIGIPRIKGIIQLGVRDI
jgi:hypothetical protein